MNYQTVRNASNAIHISDFDDDNYLSHKNGCMQKDRVAYMRERKRECEYI